MFSDIVMKFFMSKRACKETHEVHKCNRGQEALINAYLLLLGNVPVGK